MSCEGVLEVAGSDVVTVELLASLVVGPTEGTVSDPVGSEELKKGDGVSPPLLSPPVMKLSTLLLAVLIVSEPVAVLDPASGSVVEIADEAGSEEGSSDDIDVDDVGSDNIGFDETGPDGAGIVDASSDDTGIDDTGVDDIGVDDTGAEDAGVDNADVGEIIADSVAESPDLALDWTVTVDDGNMLSSGIVDSSLGVVLLLFIKVKERETDVDEAGT